MHIVEPMPESEHGSPSHFTGEVWIDSIVQGEKPSRVRVTIVHFAPGARTAWHFHYLGQTLHVIEGIGRAQGRGGGVIVLRAGDTIYTPPKEWHWHGAAPERLMTHVAIWDGAEEGPDSKWGAHVTDPEYNAAPSA